MSIPKAELYSLETTLLRESLAIPLPGSVEISAWMVGAMTEADVYILNLRCDADGRTYPIRVSPAALAGVVKTLELASQNGGKVFYWESTSIIHIGWVKT
jgi:hypothetical protein